MEVANEHAPAAAKTSQASRLRKWSIHPSDPDLSAFLARELNVDRVVGTLLVNRQVRTADDGRMFLDRRLKSLRDPADHPGVSEAADRIFSAVQAGRKICIYGDYDVDGMCASSILLECLRLAGASPSFYIPDRFEEGYGVNSGALDRIKGDGVDLVVTVDCGIASVEEADHARKIGLEYIVTDHHEFADTIPRADAVVHPRLPGTNYPFGHLCGTGVAFKLAWEIARRVSGGQNASPEFREFLVGATALAAIGTVCDVVPLEGENRILVYHGLRALKHAPMLGLAHLMKVASLDGKKELLSDHIGFTLGPRLNACGRLGQARLGVELLSTRDPQRAAELARFLDESNTDRQSRERKTFTEAKEMAESLYSLSDGELPSAFVLASDEWHPGIVGIVASRMVERYHRPCILIALTGDEGTGSGRSIPGLHLQEAMAACGEHLVTSGGHAMAAGLRIRRSEVEAFRDAFEAEAKSRLRDEYLVADIQVDMEVPLHALSNNLLAMLEAMEPFGVGNPKPLFLATNLELVGEPKQIGKGSRHLSFRVRQGEKTMRAVAFGHGDRAGEVADADGRCCLVFEPCINDFRGYPEVELRVRDFRPGPAVD